MSRALLALFLFAFTAGALAEDFSPAAKKELERLAGNWRIVSITRDGKDEEAPAELRKIHIVDNKMLVGEKGDMDIGLRIAMLAPDTTPRIVDITHPETKKTLEGIYELTDERWKMCLNGEGTAERPGSFDTTGQAKFVLVILERVK